MSFWSARFCPAGPATPPGWAPRVMRCRLIYRAGLDAFGVTEQEMIRLSEATGETVRICARDGGMMLVVGMAVGSGHFRVASDVGTRVPLNWTASGRLLLDHLAEAERRRAFADCARPSRTGIAETDPDRLSAQAREPPPPRRGRDALSKRFETTQTRFRITRTFPDLDRFPGARQVDRAMLLAESGDGRRLTPGRCGSRRPRAGSVPRRRRWWCR